MDVTGRQINRLPRLQVNVIHHERDKDTRVARIDRVQPHAQFKARVEVCKGRERD